jgi:hypothetical protein
MQNGNPYEGSWDELFANGISSITVSWHPHFANRPGPRADRLRLGSTNG